MVKLHYFKNQRFGKLKAQCERDERLFVDPEFPPETKSLYFSRATPPEPVDWKRPKVGSSPIIKSAMAFFCLSFVDKLLLCPDREHDNDTRIMPRKLSRIQFHFQGAEFIEMFCYMFGCLRALSCTCTKNHSCSRERKSNLTDITGRILRC